jgi:NAD-dependent deacetylase
MIMQQKYIDWFELFDYAEKIVALTGAGISTLSGIPDFRGKSGFYTNHTTFEGYDRDTLMDLKFFVQHPEIFYRFALQYIYPMLEKIPSIGHITLAELQKRGILDVLYTQNIDLLHTKAGAKAYELHGQINSHSCMKCGNFYFTNEEIYLKLAQGKVPHCHCGGLVKPDIVFFNEELDEKLLEQAFHDFETSDIALVIGSSLSVPPVCTLPMAARLNHGKIIIVNEQPTQYDQYATYKFNDIADFCQNIQDYFFTVNDV